MSWAFSPRHWSQALLATPCVLLLFTVNAHAETKTWNLANDFPLTKLNPAPDKYGHRQTWYFSQGETLSGVTKFPILKTFIDPAEDEAMCGVEGFYVWDKQGRTPAIWYNSGPTVEEGRDACSGSSTFVTKTVFMHPEFAGKGRSAVARWKAPTTGSVTVSGSVQLVDTFKGSKGISWKLDRGQTTVAGPEETYENNVMSFGPTAVSVKRGEYLNLELGAAVGSNGAYNSTAVSLTITNP